ncbi:MAG: cytochrome c oxidase subunit II [Sumerlaeia bacterium]
MTLGLLCVASGAYAQAGPGLDDPITNWINEPVTSIAREVRNNFWFLTLMFAPFLIIPQLVLLIGIFKFKDSANRKPATFHENVPLEIAWTAIPALVLVVTAVSSFPLIKKIETPPPADVRIEVIGHQFFWEYRYPEYGIAMSNEPLVLPKGENIVADLTSVDVNHAFWVPAFGVKMDCVPGRINQIWWNVEKTGWYKGQCAELCGALHAAMLLDVHVVEPAEFEAWIDAKLAELNGEPGDAAGAGESIAEQADIDDAENQEADPIRREVDFINPPLDEQGRATDAATETTE